jgi:hypothetical protein
MLCIPHPTRCAPKGTLPGGVLGIGGVAIYCFIEIIVSMLLEFEKITDKYEASSQHVGNIYFHFGASTDTGIVHPDHQAHFYFRFRILPFFY